MTTEEIREFVDACGWRFAKSMPQWPHEYTSLKVTNPPAPYAALQKICEHINSHGYFRYFYKKKVFYIDFEGHCYWHMGICPIAKCYNMLNRAKLPNIASTIEGLGPNG